MVNIHYIKGIILHVQACKTNMQRKSTHVLPITYVSFHEMF